MINSKILLIKRVKDCDHVEREIANIFKSNFTNEKTQGREYFSGNVKDMIKNIENIIEETNQYIHESDIDIKLKSFYGCRHKICVDTFGDINLDDNDSSDSSISEIESDELICDDEQVDVINVQFKCDTCERTFVSKQSLQNHLNNIKGCTKPKFSCKYCGKGFTSNTNMYRHMRTICSVKNDVDNNKNTIHERLTTLENLTNNLIKENKIINQRLNILQKKLETINIVQNDDTIVNISIVKYGTEDIKKLDKNELIKIISHDSILELIEMIHFNEKYPEYHNIYIPNMKDKYAIQYDGNNWNLIDKKELIDVIYNDKKNYIKENLDTIKNSLTKSQTKKLILFLSTDDNDSRILQIKEKIKLLLYNKRMPPLKIRNTKTTIPITKSMTTSDRKNNNKIVRVIKTPTSDKFKS